MELFLYYREAMYHSLLETEGFSQDEGHDDELPLPLYVYANYRGGGKYLDIK